MARHQWFATCTYNLGSLDGATKKKFVYARVSSRGQKDDLAKQIEHLKGDEV
jgi:predicted site-specific integrase-resolvase